MEWISCDFGGSTVGPGRLVEGASDVRAGASCRYAVLARGGTRVTLAGDFPAPTPGQRESLLNAAAAAQWAALTRLPGSYWVVAQGGGTTFVCGDLAASRSIFYTAAGSRTVWSSSARQLAHHADSEIDLALIAARIVAGPEHWPDATVYQDVSAVPGGYGLVLREGRHDVVDIGRVEPVLTLTEGAASFGEALTRSVHCRVNAAGGSVGVDVSGGLDSSSLAILAAESGQICAVTYSDAYTSTEDLHYAHRVAEHTSVPLRIGLGDTTTLPFAWSADQPLPDQPVAASLTMAQNRLYLRPAADLPLHFTGDGGDVVLDSSSAAWIGMVQDGQRRAARREVTGWARARNRAPRELWHAITRSAAIGHAQALHEAADTLETGKHSQHRPGVWTWCHLGISATWLTPEGRARVAELLRQAATRTTAPARADLAEQDMSLRLIGADVRDSAPLSRACQVRQVHPFLDNEVVRAGFAISPEERHGITSFKPLLAASLPQLPEWLTSRRSKGSFTRQATAGMRHHESRVAQLIRTGALATAGLIDPEPTLRALAAVRGAQAHALHDLHRITVAGQWLAAHRHQLERTIPETTC